MSGEARPPSRAGPVVVEGLGVALGGGRREVELTGVSVEPGGRSILMDESGRVVRSVISLGGALVMIWISSWRVG